MPIWPLRLFTRSTQEKATRETASCSRATVSERRSGEPKPSSLSRPQKNESASSTVEASSSRPPARTKFEGIGCFGCFCTAKDRGLPKSGKQADLWQQAWPEEAAPDPSSTHADESSHEDRAAALITRHLRAHIAKKAYASMTRYGLIWKEGEEGLLERCKLEPNEYTSVVAKLSSMNMSALRQGLGKLTENETAFFDRFTRQEFFATHFTNATLDSVPFRSSSTSHPRLQPISSDSRGRLLAIYALAKLTERKVEHKMSMTVFDIIYKGDKHFVFFGLECGKQPSKPESRFGKTLYRVPFPSPAFLQCSWSTLDDFCVITPEKDADIPRLLQNLSQDEANAVNDRCCRKIRDFADDPADAFSDIFVGRDLIPGAALSIISALRKLLQNHERLSERLLASSTPKEINGLLNAIYRPEIKVPVHFFTTDFQKLTQRDPKGKARLA